MEDIAGLLARLEAATGPDRELDVLLAQWAMPERVWGSRTHEQYRSGLLDGELCYPNPAPAYTASVDAALALVERMLPDALYSVGRGPSHSKRKRKTDGAKIPFDGFVASDDRIGEKSHHFGVTEGPTAQLAILIALLKALHFKDKP